VVVEGVTLATVVTGAITMLIIGILLNIGGLGVARWALFALAVYAFPFFVGLTAGTYAHQSGIGPIGTIVVGLAAGGVAISAGQYASLQCVLLRCALLSPSCSRFPRRALAII
jgi:hypothetical protein